MSPVWIIVAFLLAPTYLWFRDRKDGKLLRLLENIFAKGDVEYALSQLENVSPYKNTIWKALVMWIITFADKAYLLKDLWHDETKRIHWDTYPYSRIEPILFARWDMLSAQELSRIAEDRNWNVAFNTFLNTREGSTPQLNAFGLLLEWTRSFAEGYTLACSCNSESAYRSHAAKRASEFATNPEEIRQLLDLEGLSENPDLWAKFAELIDSSDRLSYIMAKTPVSSRAWMIAFEKLKAMEDPAQEHSSTFAAP
ncbi:hypothetical protein KW796_01060 [Candidatus Parcubacteria bacterium]|nr:hypothetical protein [Candidatus Parcubacteria bacterium]